MYKIYNNLESVVVELLPADHRFAPTYTLHIKQGKARTQHNRLQKEKVENKIFSYIEKKDYPREKLKLILASIYKRESWKKGIKTGVFSITKQEKQKIRESFIRELTDKGFLIK